ncbi:MAG: lactate permease LctP family transporter [Bryobacteraceae bacterium]|nr:lactate permease LctP family transporter [Bryobacteraceae bacterium]
MWLHNYSPVGAFSPWLAAGPIFVLLLLLGVLRKPSYSAALCGLAAALLVATVVYGMPVPLAVSATLYGAAFGLFPIGWIVFWAIVLYRLTVETGQMETIKNSIGSLTTDQRLQALLIAFAFGAFVEGAAGFGTPVAVAAAMLAGLGFSPFYAAAICLLANTAPVAFGSIGIPLITLQGITGLPLDALSANVGRICAPVSLIIPAYLVFTMGGWRALRETLPAVAACGMAFAGAQFYVSNYLGPYLTDILGSLATFAVLILLLRFWRPAGEKPRPPSLADTRTTILAWAPYGLLVIFVLLWGMDGVKAMLNRATFGMEWPGLHNAIQRVAPAVSSPSPYAAIYAFNLLAASGTACMLAALSSALLLRVSGGRLSGVIAGSARSLALPMLTIASVLGLAFLMNYCGATATLGMAFARTGVAFPFFSAMLGWLGVFLTGSDTSANALFGNLQVITANSLGLSPALMAAANSSGGVMGKMISLQSIAVAAAATGMKAEDESRLFRFTLRHSIILASAIGLVVLFYAYVKPDWIR